ncbi:D-alanine--D-alanine ligase family protein [Nesterenkonia sp. CL21]|uniref:D-alanine--D-alanine ligase family protein n=1 Tax=Nesterenkonia sp. CL21 TaxID=3064894 RepID=UPI00287B101E|nr:D-alanine--D-alanine ligase family protein [Nesterenkonia sp. CL21]MDS2171560.1 D-alanine--D-alanine ligase family protein [Nesterenkonia sp. CL21]
MSESTVPRTTVDDGLRVAAQGSSARPRVLVLYGGQSSEHAVSCVTAAGVLKAVDGERFDVVPVGITSNGQWTRPAVDPRTHTFADGELPRVRPTESTVALHGASNGTGERRCELLEVGPAGKTSSLGPVDVVLPLLHGPFGEDGTVQGLLESVGVPYVGAGVLASAVGMDKHFMKLAFEAAGLTVGPYETLTARQWRRDPGAALQRVRGLNLPVFVKPARAGSSVGITRVDAWEQLEEAVALAQKHDPKVVVEQGISGREIECGVLDGHDGQPPRASQLGEIVVHDGGESHQFYDFTAKYTDAAAADLSCPADLPVEAAEEIRRQAVVAFEAVDAEGISRVDFFYTDDGDVVINEINTMPGFTPISMYPQMWHATGIQYPELIAELITLALQRPVGLR